MKGKIISVVKYIFFLGVGIFLVWWQFDKMSVVQRTQFYESLGSANYWLLFPIIISVLLGHISRAVRWKILMEPLGYNPSTTNTFYAVMAGYLANTFVPRAGEILKCSLINRYEKIPVNKLIGSILVEKAFDLVCYLIFIVLTILVQVKFLGGYLKQKYTETSFESNLSTWMKLVFIIVMTILTVIFIKWLFKKFAEHRHIKTMKGFHIGLKEGFIAIGKLKKKGWFLFHTFFIWLMYLLQVYIGFSALSATSHLGMVEAFSVLSLGTLGMLVSPGGIGAFPLAVQEVLLIYNVDNVSFGWLIWGVSTLIVIVGGLLSLGLILYKNKKNNEAKQTVS